MGQGDRFLRVFKENPAPMCILRKEDGVFLDANEEFLRALGYTRDELIERSALASDILGSEVAGRILCSTAEGGVVADLPFPPRGLGESRRIMGVCARSVGLNGEETILATLADLTEARRTESLTLAQTRVLESLAAEAPLEETLSVLIRSLETEHSGMSGAVLLLDKDGVSIRLAAAPSLSEEFIRSMEALVSVGPRAGSSGTAMFLGRAVFVSDIQIDPLWEAYRPFAARFDLRACWSSPIRSKAGRILGALDMYYREVQSPREWEIAHLEIAVKVAGIAIEQKRAQNALRESEARYRSLYSNSPVMLQSVDQEGRLISVSNRWLEMMGYGREEVLGRKSTEFLTPDSRQLAEKVILPEFLRTGCINDVPYQFVKKGGALMDGQVSEVAERDTTGAFVRSMSVVIDVTNRNRMEEQLRQGQKMEAIGRVAGGVAHDFNNLLTAINGYASLALDQVDAADPAHEFLQEIIKSGDRATALTGQLLAYSRKKALAPAILNLNDVVTEMQRMIRLLLGEDIRLHSNLDPDVAFVRADRGQVEQVLLNLVINARDAMPGGGDLTIETGNQMLSVQGMVLQLDVTAGPFARLSVRDTGMGMEPELKERIFEPFFTTKAVGAGPKGRTGTGFGLSVVHGIVEQSKGGIAVESEPGRGSTFTIYFPATRPPETQEPAPDLPERIVDLAHGTEGILLVEDEESVRQFAGLALETLGYRVRLAGNGIEALQILAAEGSRIQLVISDMVMPEMGGERLGGEIRRLYPSMALLYISGYATGGGNHPIEDHSDFLRKPFSPNQLAEKVRKALDLVDSTEALHPPAQLRSPH